MKRYFFFMIIIFPIILPIRISADELYRITAKEMGFLSLDYTVTEIKRTDRLSVLHIPGFHKRTAAASRWMMCVYTDLTQKRGFEYWAVVYPDLSNEDLMVGFPNSKNEDIARTIAPEFGTKNALPIMPVEKMIYFCDSMKKRGGR
ncbi:MAG: hypothetical protein CVU43_21900 [Chloroflexi bacterium HGW-Chloroflexi-5]|jgi:hypothetical protein|nr:MAG: hypothetical protein CVU43_21900 [Chloroflexi bacterium HGW-Chloroflexi-5]